jgi:hypothetical protein
MPVVLYIINTLLQRGLGSDPDQHSIGTLDLDPH